MHVQLVEFAPFLSWIRQYGRPYLKADLLAGLTVAVVAVPQSMAYAMIAGLPVQYGLYASIVPTVVSCLWGSSAHLITGPTTAVSLVVFSTVHNLAPHGSLEYVGLIFFLSLLVGALQILMGMARLGNLLNFVSHSVLLGFMAGAAVLIGFKQLPGLLGVSMVKKIAFYEHLSVLIRNLHNTHMLTLLTGLLTIAIIVTIGKLRPRWPGNLLAMIVVGVVVALFDLDSRGVAVVGSIPRSLPPFSMPEIRWFYRLGELAPGILATAILGLVEAVSISRSIADHTRQRINVNQEFIAQGLANISAAFFSGYPGSGSFTRSAVNFRSGARTPVSGIFSALTVLTTVLVAAPLAAKLPISALAGVLVVVAYEMVLKKDILRAVKATRGDAAVLLVTFLSTLLLNIEFAIHVGVLLSIGLHLAKTSHPSIYSVAPDRKTGKLVPPTQGETCCQMDIVQVEGSLFFGSAAFVLEDLQRRLRNRPFMANLLIRMRQVNTLDASGVHVLEVILEETRRRGGGLYFSGVNHRVFEVIQNAGLLREIGETHLGTATGSAIRLAMKENFCPGVCAACTYDVFQECPELKKGNWEIFGEGVTPRLCVLPQFDEREWPFPARAVDSQHSNSKIKGRL
ncbi:MAG: SulP family inorganic anion transporter [Desulfatiglandales bacterium]